MSPTAPAVDFDGFELFDANIDRVDLVGKAANGLVFVLAKADSTTTLITPDAVRDLIKQSEAEGADMTTSTKTVQKEPVAKADDLDVTTPLAEPEAGSPTVGESQPGSAAWEAIDAATAEKWVGVLARAKNALELLASREVQEAVTHGDDLDNDYNSWDLEDAAGAIDYAISLVGGYAAREKANVGIAEETDALEKAEADGTVTELVKALTGIDIGAFAESLNTVERFGTLQKSGRVLSKTNETAIREAAENLQKVLATLPDAPVVDDDGTIVKATDATPDGEVPVEKDADAPVVEDAPAEPIAAVAKVTHDADLAAIAAERAETVEKAETAPVEPVAPESPVPALIAKQQAGNLEFADLAPLTKEQRDEFFDTIAKADDEEAPKLEAVFDADGNLKGVVDPAAIQPVQGATASATDDPAAAPAAPATPATAAPAAEVAKTETGTSALTKSDVAEIVKSEIESARHDDVQKIEELTKEVAWLKAPAQSKVAINGAERYEQRGQDKVTAGDGTSVAKSGPELQELLEKAETPAKREMIQAQMREAAETSLSALHSGQGLAQ